jgi:glyoxylase-like metal-dependent hydrolase (beta-lactamase superfamily II)
VSAAGPTPIEEARALADAALAADAPVYEVLAVRYGTRMTSKAGCYLDWERYGEPDEPLGMDYFFWVLRDGARCILVDTGFDPAVGEALGRTTLCDPALAVERLGIDPGSVELVVISHMHYDHIGRLDAFPNAALVVPRREIEFWGDPGAAGEQAGHVVPAEVERVREAVDTGAARVLDGAGAVAPGVAAILLGGHSPGQLSLLVHGAQGPVLLASDAVHYYEELALRRPFAILVDEGEMTRGYDTLTSLAASTGAVVVPGHDPEVAERFPAVAGGLAVRIS